MAPPTPVRNPEQDYDDPDVKNWVYDEKEQRLVPIYTSSDSDEESRAADLVKQLFDRAGALTPCVHCSIKRRAGKRATLVWIADVFLNKKDLGVHNSITHKKLEHSCACGNVFSTLAHLEDHRSMLPKKH